MMSLTLFSAPINGCCDNCARNDLESKSQSELRSADPAALSSCNTSFDSLQPTSSRTGSPALAPLFDMRDSQLLENDISPPQTPATPMSLLFSSPPPSPTPSDQSHGTNIPRDTLIPNHKRPMHEGSAQRRDDICKRVRESLVKWRSTKWEDEYSDCPWGPEGLLPDTVLTAFVSHGLWRVISDVKASNSTAASRWMWLEDHGQEVLDLANEVNAHMRAERAAKRQKLDDERAAARAQAREEDTQRKEAERARRQEVADAKKKLRLEEAEKKKEAAAARKLAAAMRAEEAAEKRAAKSAERAVKAVAKAAKSDEIAHRKVAQDLAKALEVSVYPRHSHGLTNYSFLAVPITSPWPCAMYSTTAHLCTAIRPSCGGSCPSNAAAAFTWPYAAYSTTAHLCSAI
jgi:hypothetical protein